ncbi:MAG: hypothetical protein RL215_866 [Planctomycetota bacterium]|jgi:hypothetical protein
MGVHIHESGQHGVCAEIDEFVFGGREGKAAGDFGDATVFDSECDVEERFRGSAVDEPCGIDQGIGAGGVRGECCCGEGEEKGGDEGAREMVGHGELGMRDEE